MKNRCNRYIQSLILGLVVWGSIVLLPVFGACAEDGPVVTDSRIKAYVYSATEVFPVTVHYGYHSYIEFSEGESVRYLHFGDQFPWTYSVVGNKLFLTSIDGYSHTNLTVITTTNRSYQFDLTAKLPPKDMDAGLTYVVRFYYPHESFDRVRLTEENGRGKLETPLPADSTYNFNYTMVGPDQIAPVAVFDDGKATYFKFPNENGVIPTISMLEPTGTEVALRAKKQGEFVMVDRIVGQYTLRYGQQLVCIFNENTYGAGATAGGVPNGR